MEGKFDVLVQGAGIGGLTLAIALEQRGYSVQVVERSPALSEIGAGIWMAPNPMQIFDRLGIAGNVANAVQALRVLSCPQSWQSPGAGRLADLLIRQLAAFKYPGSLRRERSLR
ncbi:MAG TPA: FAD-binding protein [Acidobacteriaceae bacterium]|jgi:2-polyprenyl-6-methoxyphenol hydroxylase-like FAD-dependent oxidoreductase|nr:FAD-binding protein [Acidobacteriaceae bacterium]